MVEFQPTMDSDALAVVRGGLRVGTLQRHAGRPPRLVVSQECAEFDLDELHEMVRVLSVPPEDPIEAMGRMSRASATRTQG